MRHMEKRFQSNMSVGSGEERMLDALSDFIMIIDQDHRIVWMNKAMAARLETKPEEAIKKNCYRLVHGANAPPAFCPHSKMLYDGKEHRADMYVKNLAAFCLISVSPLHDAKGRLIGSIHVARDISDLKRTEMALKESQEKYRSLVESTEDSIYLIDENCTYLFMNQKHLSRLGLPNDKVIGRTYGELHTENDTAELAKKVLEVFETGHSIQHEHKSRRDGKYFLRTLSPVKISDGKALVVTVISKNITTQKRVEDSLKESEVRLRKMAARIEEVEETERKRLSRELHDRVGQNLSALNLNLNIISSQLSEISKAKIAVRLDEAVALLEETTTHIRDVMNDLRPEVLDDYGIMAALRWHGERFSERTGVLTKVKGKELSPRPAHLVESILFRITQEALTNVYKHAHASRAFVTLEQLEGKLRLTIADDGLGFDPAVFKKLKQHGWGLIIMKERAIAIGGRVRIESVPGKGTKITVEISNH